MALAQATDCPYRTLDIFYCAQIAAAVWRHADNGKKDLPGADDFDVIYAQHRALLHEDVWREYYTPAFLREETTARFYRLPDLRDLPGTTSDIDHPQQDGAGHFGKLPRWAHLVVRTHWRKPEFPVEVLAEIATATLRRSIARLQQENPAAAIQPYSETQAYFWLNTMGLFSDYKPGAKQVWDPPWPFGAEIAVGERDLWAWERHYSPALWASSAAAAARLEPDRDGTARRPAHGPGWPDGFGVVVEAWSSGWDPEVGSAEEVAFLTGVALRETEALLADTVLTPDFAIRSHILLGVLRVACEADAERREESLGRLRRAVVEAGRLEDEASASEWIRRAVDIADKYARQLDGAWPDDAEATARVLGKMLGENGQLFWQWTPRKRDERWGDVTFRLGPAVKMLGE